VYSMCVAMVLEITEARLLAFACVVVILTIYSILDLRERRVSNDVIISGIIIGLILDAASGHIISALPLHLIALSFTSIMALGLFRLGAIGGADAKSVVTVSLVSPGIEFSMMENQIFEGIVGCAIMLFIMFLLGHIYQVMKKDRPSPTTPLIPFLLMGYLVIQLLALF
jgi:Flp pilus assembly protein protease CpaA